MTETASKLYPAALPPNWIDLVKFHLASQSDLPALEWDGQYRHFRRIYAETFARMQQGISLMWLASLDGFVIGQLFVQMACERKELADGWQRAYIYSFRIRPSYQNYGLGTRLLTFVEQDLQKRKFRYAVLNVSKTNIRARALYERLGYEVIAHEPGVWSFQDDQGAWHSIEEPAWRMEKSLD
jgi:ribosomal protein S18 acetylase RimI-like enzyme